MAVNHGWNANDSQRDRVAREADLVTMITQASPAMEQQRPLPFPRLIGKVHVIQPPRWVDSRSPRIGFLLPVEPPEVDALLLQRMMQQVHVARRELLVGNVEGHVLVGRGINTHGPRHRRVRILPRLHAGRWMQVQRGLEPLLVDVLQELFGIGEQQVVPTVTAPPLGVSRLVEPRLAHAKGSERQVPIHVDNKHVEWNIIVAEAMHQVFELPAAGSEEMNYLYDGDDLLQEVDTSGNVLARYAQSGLIDKPLSELRSGTSKVTGASGQTKQHPRSTWLGDPGSTDNSPAIVGYVSPTHKLAQRVAL